jgi:hypothetical protein
MKTKASMLVLVVLLFSALAAAQTTPYSTPNFSATFNSPVTTTSDRNANGTSTNYLYSARAKGIEQSVCVRVIDHDIDLDRSSTDYYAGEAAKAMTLDDRKDGTYQGHLYVLVRMHDATLQRRVWVLLVNARTVIWLFQQGAVGTNDSSDWNTFSDSLVIK